MKIKFNERTLQPEFIFEEEDYKHAVEIEQLIKGGFHCRKCGMINQNNAWTTLKGYFASAREAIIESMKQGLRSRVKRSMTDIKAAQLDGFDSALSVPTRVIAQAQMMRDLDKKRKEAERGRTDEY